MYAEALQLQLTSRPRSTCEAWQEDAYVPIRLETNTAMDKLRPYMHAWARGGTCNYICVIDQTSS